MRYHRFFLFSLLAVATSLAQAMPSASSWDDEDDIYYNASKAAKPRVNKVRTTNSGYTPPAVARTYDDPATYTPMAGSGLNVDVDAYNRRGQFLVSDSIPFDSVSEYLNGDMQKADTYAYTRRLERYHNGDIVNGSNDRDLIDSYYSQPSQGGTDINVYVYNDPWGYNSWYGNGWYNPYYSWSWGRPWYSGWYGPSWSWGWGGGWYDPWYSWSWGWDPSWGWGPGCGWGGTWWPGHIHHPSTGGNSNWSYNNPGLSGTHRPSYGSGVASTNTRRPGGYSAGASGYTRPGNMGRPGNYGQGSGRYTSGSSSTSSYGTGSYSGGSRGTINTNRGRNNSSNSSSYNTRSNSSSSRSSWNSSSSSSSSSSRSSWSSGSGGGGSRSTHGSSGGGYSGGGGGGRGRR